MLALKQPKANEVRVRECTDVANALTEIDLEFLRSFNQMIIDPTVDVSDEGSFIEILQTAFNRNIVTKASIAEECQVNRSTVTRWCEGKTSPNKMARKAIAELIAERLQAKIDAAERILSGHKCST